MKPLLCLLVLSAIVPFTVSARSGAKAKAVTLFVSSQVAEPCVLVNGSGYAASKSVTIDVDGPNIAETFTAPADGSGNFALYIYQSYAPGYYTVTTYQGTGKAATLMATADFDVQ